MVLACPNGQQDYWCPQTVDDVLPSVVGLLPPGPAWDGAAVAGTVQNKFWRAYSGVLAFTYKRLCDYVEEFYCATVNESRDQWVKEYGLDLSCDPYGQDLCLKVASQGGATCDYFVDMAERSGWVVTCDDVSKWNEPIAGGFEVGCTPLGPTPVFAPLSSNMGYGQQYACLFGEVVQHPDPAMWEFGKTRGASCPVPGSNLGEGPDDGEACCFIVGWYDPTPPVAVEENDFCRVLPNVINFDCPANNTLVSSLCPSPKRLDVFDSTGNYSEWGLSFVWQVTVDVAASRAAQELASPPIDADSTISAAGNFMAGDISLPDGSIGGSPLCFAASIQPDYVLCFLDQLKPAHTRLNVEILRP